MLNFESAAGSTISLQALSTKASTMKPTNCLKTVHRLRISSTFALLPCIGAKDDGLLATMNHLHQRGRA